MGRTTPATPETKAAALADLESGESLNATARKYGVSRAAVRQWRDRAGIGAPVSPQETRTKDELLGLVIEHTRANLAALAAIAQHCQDKAWLNKQSAHDLAYLYGITFDKAARLLASLAGDGGAEPESRRPGLGAGPVGRLPSPPQAG